LQCFPCFFEHQHFLFALFMIQRGKLTSSLALQLCVSLGYQAHVVLRETDEGGNKLLSTGLVWSMRL
jgi:hypothetical protein